MSPDYSPLHAGMSCGFLPAAKEMSRQVFVLQHKSWMSSRHPSMQQDNTEQQRDNWNSESEGGGAYVSTAQCLPSSNKHEPSPIVSGAPVVHYVNIRPVPHHDYIQTPSRKWSHTQRPPQPSSLRWWTFLAADLPNQETGVDGERAGSSRGGR